MPYHTKALKSAEYYLNQNWSIFPVFADSRPDFAKQPAVRWQMFQQRPPLPTEISGWFADGQFLGIAIVTGHLSRLVVLDFDTPDLYHAFCQAFPHLAHTRTIATRRGKHLYFGLLPSLHAPNTLHGVGVDLQAEGAYVVAPPTTIDGFTYTVERDLPLHTLIPADVALIQAFIHNTHEQKNRGDTPPRPSRPITQSITQDQLHALYLDSLHIGRNNALFWVSCIGRDYGTPQHALVDALAKAHASRPPIGTHRPETYRQRYQEAQRTIASAYSRPPRPIKHPQKLTPQLPNRLREHFLAMKNPGLIRTIEALRLVGITPGTAFTAKEAIAHLSGIVGRDTVRNSLNTISPIGAPVFASPSPRTPLMPNGIADSIRPQATNSCELVTLTNSGKNAKGRPATTYIMPSNDQLLALFTLPTAKRSDPLTLDDLKKAVATRKKLHQTFLTRLPGRWAITTFAKRMAVSTRTIRRYHAQDQNFRHIALHHITPVRWDGIKWLFEAEFPHKGYFLTDSKNKKYPAKQGIAERLLAKRQHVLLYQRIPNFWWYGASDMPPISPTFPADVRVVIEKERAKRFASPKLVDAQFAYSQYEAQNASQPPIPIPDQPMHAQHVAHTAVHQQPLLPDMPIKSPPSALSVDKSQASASRHHKIYDTSFRAPLADDAQERLAMRLYTAINAKATTADGRITKASARRLITRYSACAIEEALRLLHTRQNITKPVGFVSTVLRSLIPPTRVSTR